MEVKKIYKVIENFAPLELQEAWDCSGVQVDIVKDVRKIILCLSVTENIIRQASKNNCDLIISHHPLFFIPFAFKNDMAIYSAHTNLDKTDGGTTDTLITKLGFDKITKQGDFLRVVELEEEISAEDFIQKIKICLNIENLRVVNNYNQSKLKRLAFCAGSGADFLGDAQKIRADIFITGDVKYHSALDSGIIMVDVGHFESEHSVLETIYNLIKPLGVEVIIADEKTPFINY